MCNNGVILLSDDADADSDLDKAGRADDSESASEADSKQSLASLQRALSPTLADRALFFLSLQAK